MEDDNRECLTEEGGLWSWKEEAVRLHNPYVSNAAKCVVAEVNTSC